MDGISINLILVIATAAVSYFAFENSNLMNQLILYPYKDVREKKWYTIFTSGFLHADWNHLLFNMFTLYFLGDVSLMLFKAHFPDFGSIIYVLFYISALGASSIPSFIKNRDNPGYRALGASGGVSAIIFHFVMFAPWEKLLIFGVIPIPAIILGILYMVYESYMAKKGTSNIGHVAHLSGAVYGVISFFVIFPELGSQFFAKLLDFHF